MRKRWSIYIEQDLYDFVKEVAERHDRPWNYTLIKILEAERNRQAARQGKVQAKKEAEESHV
jgi:hypothetical protein